MPHPQYYQQYLLHCDPLERFSMVSFVWGRARARRCTITRFWGYVGMLRGSEINQRYVREADGGLRLAGAASTLLPGDVERLAPEEGDIHQVSNAHADRVSISVHLYGGNIGAVSRHVYDPVTGVAKPFVSGYSSTSVPNPGTVRCGAAGWPPRPDRCDFSGRGPVRAPRLMLWSRPKY